MGTNVSESTGYGPNLQMSLLGYVIAVILLIFMIPMLPVLIPAYVIWRVFFAPDDVEPIYKTWRKESGRSAA